MGIKKYSRLLIVTVLCFYVFTNLFNLSFSYLTVHAEEVSENYALGKNVEASSSYPDYPASAIVDGRRDRASVDGVATFWAPFEENYVEPYWAIVDLEQERSINKVLLYFNKNFNNVNFECAPVHIKLEVSNDKTNWTTVYDQDTGIDPPGASGINNSPAYYEPYECSISYDSTVRYIKLTPSNDWVHIVEMEVYGEPIKLTSIRSIDDIVVTEGIANDNLPLPHQAMYATQEKNDLRGRIDIYPSTDPNKSWKEDINNPFNPNQPGIYHFTGTINNNLFTSPPYFYNPDNLQPEVDVVVQKAGIKSFVVPNQIGSTSIDYTNQQINIKVFNDTDLTKVYPIITTTDYTTCSPDNNQATDFSNGSVEYTVTAKNGNSYKWNVTITKQDNYQAELYVSPDGNDNNPGTIEAPLKTIAGARDFVRTINSNMTGDIIIYFRGGTYFIDEPIIFNKTDSGTNGYNVLYKAYPNETPVISGGKKVEGWEAAPDKAGAYRALAPSDVNYSREIYVNGRRAVIARNTGTGINGWSGYDNPNMTWYDNSVDGFPKYYEDTARDRTLTVHQGYTTDSSYEFNNMNNWRNVSDIEMVYLVGWTFHIIPVKSVQTNSSGGLNIEMKPQAFYDVQTGIGGPLVIQDPNYVQNAFELLDEPGESYFDRSSKYIYYIPRNGEDMQSAQVYVPKVEDLILGSGESNDHIKNISFTGISFECTGYNSPNSEEGAVTGQASFLKRNGNWTKMPGAIRFDYSSNIRFDDCKFKMIGKAGVDFHRESQNNTVIGSEFDGIGSSGIQIGPENSEESNYAADSHVVKNNKILANKIYNIGESYNGAIGVWLGLTKGTIVSYNDLDHVSYTGISSGWSWGYDCPTIAGQNVIEYNHIRNCLEKLHDGGGIYMLGYQPGSRIKGNHVHDNVVGAPGGIYLDEGSSGYTDISRNVVYRVASSQPDTFFFNRNVGYWSEMSDRDIMVGHMDAVMTENYPHNHFTYPGSPSRPNPSEPDMSIPSVVDTISKAGNHKSYSYIIDDNDIENVYQGTWVQYTQDPDNYLDTEHYSNTQDSYIEYEFIGTGVDWIGAKNSNLGYADIYLDGQLVQENLDCYEASSKQHQQVLYSVRSLANNKHIIKIVVSGDKNTNSSNTYIVHDAFKIWQ